MSRAGERHMSKRSGRLAVLRPQCRFCERYWTPEDGVVASSSYCSACVDDRRAIAAELLGLRPLTAAEKAGRYLLPRVRHVRT